MAGPVRPEEPLGFDSAFTFFHATSGIGALQLITHSALAASVRLALVAEELEDMSGLALLERVAAMVPRASRVLVLEPGAAVPDEAELLRLGVQDAWRGPLSGERLVRRAHARAPWLARISRLHEEVRRARASLARARTGYLDARAARDRLVRRVGEALEAAANGDAGRVRALEAWWSGYRSWRQLRDLPPPARIRTVELGAVLDRVAERVGSDAARPARPSASLAIRVDPSLAARGLAWVAEGMLALCAPGAASEWGWRRERAACRLDVAAGPLRSELVELEPARLLDPFARLEGGPLAGFGFELPLGEALLRGCGLDPVVERAGDRLLCALRLPRRSPARSVVVDARPPL